MSIKHLSFIGIFTVFLVACTPEEQPEPVVDDSEVVENLEVAPEPENLVEANYEIEMGNFEFSVTEMTASPGDSLMIVLTNNDGFHDFVIDEFGVQSSVLETGETEILQIDIPEDAQPGDYEYYCSVGNHREMGMVGTLTIVE